MAFSVQDFVVSTCTAEHSDCWGAEGHVVKEAVSGQATVYRVYGSWSEAKHVGLGSFQ